MCLNEGDMSSAREMCSRFALVLSVANEQIVPLIYSHADLDFEQVSMEGVESCDLATNPGEIKARCQTDVHR
jgi:hypothetical protein